MENELSEEQMEYYHFMNDTNDNLFITGEAGTGKSYLVDYFIEHTEKSVARLAPTGTAAINIGGQTIHSFFGLPVITSGEPMSFEVVLARLNKSGNELSKEKIMEKVLDLETLIIDEVSMLRSDVADTIDQLCRYIRGSLELFGGIQVIFVGDLYQLPPIVRDGNLPTKYETEYFYSGLKQEDLKKVRLLKLTHIFRQKDPEFINLLNDIRVGRNIAKCYKILDTRVQEPPKDVHPIVLATKNATVETINNRELSTIDSDVHIFRASYYNPEEITDDERNQVASILSLKVGMRVMSVINVYDNMETDDKRRLLYNNGQLGTILSIDNIDGKDVITVSFDDIGTFEIGEHTWDINRYQPDSDKKLREVRVASITQIPLKPAYALTVHKAQGQTYNSIQLVDFNVFSCGQLYTALSRCTSLDKIYIDKPLKKTSIKVDPRVQKIMGDELK